MAKDVQQQKLEKIERVEEGIKALLNSTTPTKEQPLVVNPDSGSQRIMKQIDDMCDNVYEHVVARIRDLKARLDQLETVVTSKCEHMKLYTEQYINLAERAMKASDHIDAAVEALEKHVGEDKQPPEPNAQ